MSDHGTIWRQEVIKTSSGYRRFHSKNDKDSFPETLTTVKIEILQMLKRHKIISTSSFVFV